MRTANRAIRDSARDKIAELAPPPAWIEPQLCKLVTTVPTGDSWLHEVKFDGYRMHARIVDGEVALLTRTGLDWTAKYPGIAAALAEQQRPQMGAGAFGVRPPDDDELLAVERLRLDPHAAIAGSVGLVHCLRDDAFEPMLCGPRVDPRSVAYHVAAEAHRRRRPAQQPFETRLAVE